MRPTDQGEGFALYRGDCREILGCLSADHVITDPPFEAHMHVSKQSARRVRTDGYKSPTPLDFASIDGVRETVTPLMVAACSGWMMAFCTPEGIAPWRDAIEAAGARYKRACFFCKTDSAPQFNGQGPAFAVEPFVTAWCGKGHSRWNGGGRRNWWAMSVQPPDRQGDHPTEKPLELMLELVELFTKPGQTVLDPFMGSATTGIACLALGRKFIGIEVDQNYYALGKARIEARLMGRDEGTQHIVRATGKTADAGPLFSSNSAT